MSEEQAERTVNFRLLHSTSPGSDDRPGGLSVRFEAAPRAGDAGAMDATASSWSAVHGFSVHYPLATELGCLRVKQYLFDWGPMSALDHAALYDHRPEDLRMWPLDEERVVWTGWDYAGRRALSMLAWGTNVELRELSGDHPESLLVDVARSFQPLSDRRLSPMAERSYWSRWPGYGTHMVRDPAYRLPSSLWLWRWPWLRSGHAWSSALAEFDLPGLRRRGGEVFAPAWRFDSSCVFGEPEDPEEVQLLFLPASGLGHAQLWLRRFVRCAGAPREPASGEWPLLDRFVRRCAIHRLRLTGALGLQAFVASRDLDHGPHDVVWWWGRHGFLLQVSAAVRHPLDHAVELLSRLLGERLSRSAAVRPES